MEYMQINSLKNQASRIGLGTWAIGGWMWGGSDHDESIKTILSAIEHGINLIDTAPVYGFGVSEKIVGEAVKQSKKRDQIIIATKVGLEWQNEKIFRNTTPARLRKELEDSLVRLQTDYIDIYQIHWPDPLVPIEATAKTMQSFLQEGKIRAIGVSNFSPDQMEQFLKIVPIHTSQPPYNLFEREIEKNILPFTEKHNIVTLAYGAICRGLLSGKMKSTTKFDKDDIRNADPKFQAPYFDKYLKAVDALNTFSQHEYGKSVLALAVRWILDRGRTIALWGARQPKQLETIDEALGWNLGTDAMQKIDTILAEHIKKPLGPEFMAPPTREKASA